MKLSFFAHKIAILAILTLSPVRALTQQAVPGGSEARPATTPDYRAALITLARTLAERNQVQIVLDPDIEVTAAITAPANNLALPVALNHLTRQMQNVAWRRVYGTQKTPLSPPEKLAALARALDHLPQQELGVENPPGQRATLFLPQNRPRTFDAQLRANSFDTRPTYLLYNTALSADGKTAAERVADLQQQQMKLMASMPTEQMPNPMQVGLQIFQQIKPAEREARLAGVGEAGMQTWQNTPSSTRDEMMAQFLKTAQGGAAFSPPTGPGTNTGTNLPPPKNYSHPLREIADSLAKRHHVRILLDPDLFLTTSPVRPADTLTLHQALDTLTKPLQGVTWRCVYQKQPTVSPLPVRKLVAAVRTLENLHPSELVLENPAAQRIVTVQTEVAATSLPDWLTGHQFSLTPIYVIYAEQEESESGQPADQRLARMQDRQAALILSMDPSQMNQTMTEAIAQYSHLNPDAQSRLMRLPVMALMMATWLPRKAQEDKAVPPL